MNTVQSFAIVPAAGHSRRMGRPKLLLPWKGIPIIHHVISAWIESRVTQIFVVIRKGDDRLLDSCQRLEGRVSLVVPETDPPDMKSSVQHALTRIKHKYEPAPRDVWLLAPADMPRINGPFIDDVLEKYDPKFPSIVVPEADGRRGHPVLFPWPLSDEISALGHDQGVNAIVDRSRVTHLTVDDGRVFDDIDTSLDYGRLTEN